MRLDLVLNLGVNAASWFVLLWRVTSRHRSTTSHYDEVFEGLPELVLFVFELLLAKMADFPMYASEHFLSIEKAFRGGSGPAYTLLELLPGLETLLDGLICSHPLLGLF